jgi:hypothetical protein
VSEVRGEAGADIPYLKYRTGREIERGRGL